MERNGALRAVACVALGAALLYAAGCGSSSSAAIPHDPSDPPGLSALPAGVSMGPSDTAAVNAIDPGYKGQYTAETSDGAVATVAPNGVAQFLITGVAPGTCTVTLSDSSGHSAKVSVSVQTTVIGGQ
jgi:hypothetical protein